MAIAPTLNYRSNLYSSIPTPGTPLLNPTYSGAASYNVVSAEGQYSPGPTSIAASYGDYSTTANVYVKDSGLNSSYTQSQGGGNYSNTNGIYTNPISDPRITSGLYGVGGAVNSYAPHAQSTVLPGGGGSSGRVVVQTPMWDGPYLTSSYDVLGNKTARTYGTDYPYNQSDYTSITSTSASDFFRQVTSNNVKFDIDSGLGGSASISGPLFSFRPTFGRLAGVR